MTEQDILSIIQQDDWMMEILQAVQTLNLPDWWIGAGFVRSKVWDHLHGYQERTPLPDIDVIYFDPSDFTQEEAILDTIPSEIHYETLLKEKLPSISWSVTNQARMHHFHKTEPYNDSTDALSDWSETATCIGVRLDNDKLLLTAPYGVDDLTKLILRPIPGFEKKYSHDPKLFQERVTKKQWLNKWPKLKLVE